MLTAFASAEEARAWLEEEIRMFHEDGQEIRAGFYRRLLDEGSAEPVIVGQVGEKGRLWDGWHRAAAAMARSEHLAAIVGTAADEQLHSPSPSTSDRNA